MNQISSHLQQDPIYHRELASQQQTLISALKQEILRLQEQVGRTERERNQYMELYQKSQKEIDELNEKINNIRDKNSSLVKTLEVFHREFIKQDYANVFLELKEEQKPKEQPFFIELLKNMKTKFNMTFNQPLNIPQKSYLNDYYGFFFHSDVEEPEIRLYQEVIHSKKPKASKIRNFGKKNFFNEKFRHIFWFNSIQNHQKITFKLYETLVDDLNSNQENKLPQNSIIDKDLRRMDFKIDSDKSKSMEIQVKKCLQLWTLYRPDIGYVQGMSYIAWMLLIRMESYQAFVCFSNIMLHDSFVHSLYMFKKDKINKIMNFFQECLMDKKPKLAKHLIKLQVQPQLFIIEWAYTMFSRCFNLRIVSKIWDLWFSEGFNAFFKVTMAIMDLLQSEILEQKEDDKVIEIIRTQTQRLDENQFLKHLNRQKLFEDLKLTNEYKK